jgi:biotin transport system substrate-specific component
MSRFTSRDLALVATFAGVIAALGLVPGYLPTGVAVPITLQTLGVMLAGSLIGARRGTAAVLLFLALVALGLPLLAGGRGGLGILVGPSVGYFVGWIFGTLVIGFLSERRRSHYDFSTGFGINVIGGILVIHVFGLAGLMIRLGLSLDAAVATDLWFILGDLVKAVIAASVAVGVHRAYPGLLGGSSRPRIFARA